MEFPKSLAYTVGILLAIYYIIVMMIISHNNKETRLGMPYEGVLIINYILILGATISTGYALLT